MLQYSQCKIDYRRDSTGELRNKIAEILRIRESEIQQIKILKKSIDARKSHRFTTVIRWLLSVSRNKRYCRKTERTKIFPYISLSRLWRIWYPN